jgi:hypothetical protein
VTARQCLRVASAYRQQVRSIDRRAGGSYVGHEAELVRATKRLNEARQYEEMATWYQSAASRPWRSTPPWRLGPN